MCSGGVGELDLSLSCRKGLTLASSVSGMVERLFLGRRSPSYGDGSRKTLAVGLVSEDRSLKHWRP